MSEPQIAQGPSGTTTIETELGQPEPQSATLYDQSWLVSLSRPFLIAVMVVCIDVALLAFLQRFVPSAAGAYAQVVVFMGMIAAIVGSITTTWLAQPAQRLKRSTGYRIAEIVLLLVMTRLLIWAVSGTWPTPMTLMTRPFEALVDGFIFGALVVGLSWIMSTEMTNDLIQMALRPDDLYTTRSFANRWQDNARPVHTDRGAILRRFVTRWVIGGVFLVMLASSSQIAPSQNGFLAIARQNIAPPVIVAVIIYFLTGLVLISQGQLAVLRARWTLQKTPNSRAVLRNWSFYAFGLILIVGLLATLMPFGGTFRFAQILAFIIHSAYLLLFNVFRTVMMLLLLLISLFTGESPPETPMEAPPPAQFVPPPPPAAGSEFPAWAGGVVFWLIAALLLGYAAYIYFSGKGLNAAWLRHIWQMLRERWAQFFGAYQDWRMTHLHFSSERKSVPRGNPLNSLTSWLRLRNLDPDQQVRYYYFSILHRAEQAGIARRSFETPDRYAPRLAEKTAQTQEDEAAIAELTSAFVHVRYAGEHANTEQLDRLKTIWNHVRSLLRKPSAPSLSSESGPLQIDK